MSGLRNRVFLMNNVHDGFPSVFQTRWAMSFLAGPLARGQISRLMADRKSALKATESESPAAPIDPLAIAAKPAPRPAVPAGIEERFLTINQRPQPSATLVYRPALYAEGSMHFIRKTAQLDLWRDAKRMIPCDDRVPADLWESSIALPEDGDLVDQPDEEIGFAEPPSDLLSKGKYRSYRSQFKDYLYRHNSMVIYKSPLVAGYAPAGDESDARAYFAHRLREQRDQEIEKLRDKYQSRIESLDKKIATAEDRVERERGQSRTSMISAGSSVIGVLLGGFLGGRRTKMSTAARGVGYATQQSEDVRRAEAALSTLEAERRQLEADLDRDLNRLHEKYDTDQIELEPTEIPPRKSDLNVGEPLLLWLPWQIDSDGRQLPLY